MQRSSDSIASLAAALAKAQAELVNPEKSLMATIRGDGPDDPARPFRYAPLSSGLEIVRKTLGQHAIATVQTTSIDPGAGFIKLTTMLAHASGEWIASDWPVCAVSETATPHRMGAALTYARRYALFTLVGIAGEDDLDAPDLATPTNRTMGFAALGRSGHNQLNQHNSPQRVTLRRDAKGRPRPDRTTLGTEASAQLRDQLIAELAELGGSDAAAMWAHRSLGQKNQLIAADAECVEEAFQTKLASLAVTADAPQRTDESGQPPSQQLAVTAKPKKRTRSKAIDKGALLFPEPRRVRDRDHVKFVARHPCLICGRQPADAHHLRFAQSRALGRKVSDEFTVPLCRGHHREVHRCGDEATWWRNAGVDPTVAARSSWLESHPQRTAHEESTPSH
jgi:ERF superfamily